MNKDTLSKIGGLAVGAFMLVTQVACATNPSYGNQSSSKKDSFVNYLPDNCRQEIARYNRMEKLIQSEIEMAKISKRESNIEGIRKIQNGIVEEVSQSRAQLESVGARKSDLKACTFSPTFPE